MVWEVLSVMQIQDYDLTQSKHGIILLP